MRKPHSPVFVFQLHTATVSIACCLLANFAGAAERFTADGKPVAETRATGFESYYAAVKQSSVLIKHGMARPLTAREHFDLSLSLFGTGRFAEAALTAQIGMGLTKEDVERAAFFGVLAQSRGAMGDYQEANRAALEGHRLSPLSKELAAMRVVYSTKTGNGAQLAAAEDALAGLEEAGERVFLGLMVRFLWQNRKTVVTVLTALGPVVDQIKDRWPQHKTAIEAGIQTLKTMWTVAEKIESTTPVTPK